MNWADKIFTIETEEEFNAISLVVFLYQKKHNQVYSSYLKHIEYNNTPKHYSEIPFLPIQFFKTHKVITQEKYVKIFESSGTSSENTSKHYVQDLSLYHKSAIENFSQMYGNIEDYTILALLPSYLERTQSSLIDMVKLFMDLSNKKENGFFLYNYLELKETLIKLEQENKKTLLIGVAFALLDFFAEFPMLLKNTTILETGGMKGRRKEIIKKELHQILKKQSGANQIYSEYGMTELLSQCYTKQDEYFVTPNWMKILVRDVNDPFSILSNNNAGGINIIDLANVHSCSFIATDDLGRKIDHNKFEVLGRFDNSDIRGCNLLAGF